MTASSPDLDTHCALVLIDLQEGIARRDTAPHAAADVVARAAALAKAFRARRLPVILVTVGWAADMADAPCQKHAAAIPAPADPAAFVTIVPELGAEASDIAVRKHQWGAFHGTDLDVQLRRRGITQIVLAGIATNMGVESTARAAWEHGYSILFAEDATSSFSTEMHRFAFEIIFPRLGLVSDSEALIAGLAQ
ncbi:hydrolase [Sphingomonas solaris]|uniref:Hydrolase n=1 Tax=Alterirhizorhabdus solaris TaxID=2529389 RepID=A0A558RAZ9_9SPHN|nr:hydrolase [Sphingomonas solaris]TVV76531.1 hydrolase [Sphingomonas solaris]